MRKLNSLLFSILLMLVTILPFQSVSAVDVPLKKDDPAPATIGTNSMIQSYSLESVSVSTVTATLNDGELGLNFNKKLGVAQITIEDQYGFVVYQNALNTNRQSEIVIATGSFDSGNYTVKIEYGTTTLSGAFQLY